MACHCIICACNRVNGKIYREHAQQWIFGAIAVAVPAALALFALGWLRY